MYVNFILFIEHNSNYTFPFQDHHPTEFSNLLKRYNNYLRDVDRAAAKAAKDGQRDQRHNSQTAVAALNAQSIIPKLMTIPLNENSKSPNEEITDQTSLDDASTSGSDRQHKQMIIRTVSRISLHLLRDDLTRDGKSITGAATPHFQQEHFVINSCKVLIDVKSKDKEDLFLMSPQRRQEILESIPIVIPSLESPSKTECWNLYDQNGLDSTAKDEAFHILHLIDSKKELGVLVSDLPQLVGELQSSCSLEHHMNFLTGCRIVLRVGVVAARFVSFDHVHPWLTQSFRLTRKGKEKLEPYNPTDAVTTAVAGREEEFEEVAVSTQPEVVVNPVAPSLDDTATPLRRTRRRVQQVAPQSAKKPKTVDSLSSEYSFYLLLLLLSILFWYVQDINLFFFYRY